MRHGTKTAYQYHKCRCDLCRGTWRDYLMAWRRKNGIPPRGNPVTDGVLTWASQADAGKALGVSGSTIRYHLETHGDLSRVGCAARSHNSGRKTPVRIGNREWQSQSALARYLGMPTTSLWRLLQRDDRMALTAALMKADAKAANVRIA